MLCFVFPVPFLFVFHKKDGKTVLQAFNQCRIYCISGVKFLAALGIIGVPVYGLVTTGMQGTIMVTWKSRELDPAGVIGAKVCSSSADSQLHLLILYIGKV